MMLYLVIFILLSIIIIISLYIIKVCIKLEYVLNNMDDDDAVTFSILNGLIKYRYIPSSMQKNKKRKSVQQKSPKQIDESWIDRLEDKYKNIKEVIGIIRGIKFYLRKKLYLKDFNLEVEVGTGDACYTAILTGAVWGAAGAFTSYITSTFKTMRQCVNVKPNYMEETFKAELYCIFDIKLVYIIVVGIKYMLLRFKEKRKKPQKTKNTEGGVVNG